jgi:hypothetical protein
MGNISTPFDISLLIGLYGTEGHFIVLCRSAVPPGQGHPISLFTKNPVQCAQRKMNSFRLIAMHTINDHDDTT